jgi:hypothetical protein
VAPLTLCVWCVCAAVCQAPPTTGPCHALPSTAECRNACCTTPGLPPNNLYWFCPSGVSSSCYRVNASNANYATHKANCRAVGGDLVSFNSPEEQLLVEQYFVNTTNVLAGVHSWIGVELGSGSRYRWFLADGTYVGEGHPYNGGAGAMYAHW